MNVTQLLSLFRRDMRDDAPAHNLWSDDEIYSYMDEAQKMFCRLTDGIHDSVSSITSLAIEAGDTFVPYSKKILHIKRAYLDSDKQEIKIVNDSELSPTDLSQAAGKVRALVVGMDAANLRMLPETLDDDVIKLSVTRIPLIDINAETVAAGSVELEIEEVHHRALLWWMFNLAHQKHDAETYDKSRSGDFEDRFRQYCISATTEKNRRHRVMRTVKAHLI